MPDPTTTTNLAAIIATLHTQTLLRIPDADDRPTLMLVTPHGATAVLDRDTLVTLGCAERGCTCTPDVSTATTDGITTVCVAHDDGCPAGPPC
jgi:hypothetical protein